MKTAKDFILKHWNPEIIPGECELKHFFDEMDRLMQLYSDQQNKEKDLDLIAANQYVSELRKENKELREELTRLKSISMEVVELGKETAKTTDAQEAEIQRLTKEVEELRGENGELESKNIALEQAVDAFNYEIIKRDGIIKENARISELMSSDIQRLRELLDRCRPYLTHDWGTDPEPEELKKEIDNELNPKP